MRINNIILKNFRCFEELNIEFADKANILIGKNGSGKTNLLTAIVYCLSFPFANNKLKGIQTIAQSNPDLKIAQIDNKGRYDARFDDNLDDYIYPIQIKSSATLNDRILTWEFVKEKKNGGLKSSLYKEAFEQFQNIYNEGTLDKPLPVLAYFSDSFPHIESNISVFAKSILRSDKTIPRNFGYYKWDERVNCIGIWKEKFINSFQGLVAINMALNDMYQQLLDLNNELQLTDDLNKRQLINGQISHHNSLINELKSDIENSIQGKEVSFVERKLKLFSEPLKSEIQTNRDFEVERIVIGGSSKIGLRVKFIFSNREATYFEDLPQGYKRLFSIVMDIAYRSFILNKDHEPTGIVIIDEIETHLHPSLQQEALQRIIKTFPKIQFIISTHSPLVISNINADGLENKIIKLQHIEEKYYSDEVENIYGIDYSTNLAEVMDVGYRISTIDKLINMYLVLYGNKKEAEAKIIWNKLEEYLGGTVPYLLQKEINHQKKMYQ